MDLIETSDAIKLMGISKRSFYIFKKLYGFKTYMGHGKSNLYDRAELQAFKELPKEHRKTNK